MKKHSSRGLSYQARLTVICLLLVSIPIGLFGIVSISRGYTQMQNSIQAQADQGVQYLDHTLSSYFEQIENLTVLPLFDNSVVDVLVKHASGEEKMMTFEDNHRLTTFLNSVGYDKDMVTQVALFVGNGTLFRSDGFQTGWDPAREDWMHFCATNPYRTFILVDEGTLYACRALEQPLYRTPMGYIRVRLDGEFLQQLIDGIYLPDGSRVYIYNDFNQFLYPAGEAHPDILSLDIQDDDRYQYSLVASESTKLSILVQLSREDILRELRLQCAQLATVYAAMLMLGWLMAYYASSHMTRPIVKLKEKMQLVGRGEFDTRMPVGSNDEIGQLESMFNSMTENVETLIHEVYEVSLASRDAQISALQSQINPHFLYNTLETINMMSISAGNYDISEAVSNLGRMMRYCVSNENHFASLQEEFAFVSAYYDIQKLRDEHLESLEILCPPELTQLTVPKLLLQPFVENVIQHGVGDSSVDIRILAEVSGKDLSITIENNGLPLDPDSREKLRRSLLEAEQQETPKSKSGKGYGLANVHRRLRLLYGNDYGITLDESVSQGARFRIRLKQEVKNNV